MTKKKQKAPPEFMPYQWALPDSLEIPPDPLRARLDFHQDCIILHLVEDGVITTNMVSAREVVLALLSEMPLNSGLLPNGALWWSQSREGVEVGLWEPAKVWVLALQQEAFKPPRRIRLPMPGLIFACSPAKPPRVYAAKRRPRTVEDTVYHAPFFNTYTSGNTCAGSHSYPSNVLDIPHSFMISFFTDAADTTNRSQKHPLNLLDLWNELEGQEKYPLDDLVVFGTLKEIIK